MPTMTTLPDVPKIEFPCLYPIKVMGESSPDFKDFVVEVLKRHDAELDETIVTERISSKGTFSSVTVTITATGIVQLEAIHADLKATGRVKMVL